MIVIQEDGNYFGETKVLGIGNAKPELKYGKVARKLREDAGISVQELSKEFSIKADLICKMEDQEKGMTEDIMKKYCDKFNVKKEDFFDTNTARLILGDNGVVLKTFKTAKECRKVFTELMEEYLKLQEEDNKIKFLVDFRKVGEENED